MTTTKRVLHGAATAVVAGCSTPAPATGPATDSPSITGYPSRSRPIVSVAAAPKPRNPTRYRDTKCAIRTEQQAAELGASAPEPGHYPDRGCHLRVDTHNPPLLTFRIMPLDNPGLTDARAICAVDYVSCTATTIVGYPIIHVNGHLHSTRGLCTLQLGVCDHASVKITDEAPEAVLTSGIDGIAGPRCDRADRAAALVIHNPQAGG